MTGPTPYQLLSSTTIPLTPEVVEEHKGLPPSPTERILDKKRVAFLRQRLDAGLFHPPHWVQAVVAGRKIRANGMHSSTMLSETNGAFPEGLHVHIDTYACPDMDSLALLFRQFDDRRSSRSPADVAGAYQGLRPELAEVPRYVAKQGIEAIAWYQKVVLEQKDALAGDDRYTAFNNSERHPFLQWLGEVFPASVPQDMAKPPIFAAMYGTYERDKDAADDFWKEIARGGREYEEDFPTTVLADWLHRLREGEMQVKPKGIYQGCVYAWNAMRDGKTSLKDIRCDIRKTLHKIA